jgi:glycosyltransferase involved in cell wall biosynthesis
LIIALVTDATGFGGAEIYLSELVTTLRDRHRFVAFVSDGADRETVTRLTHAGAEIRVVAGLRRMPTPGAAFRLARAIRALRPDVIHVNLTDQGDGIAPLIAARLSGRPTAATLNLVIPGRARWREQVSRLMLKVPRVLICVSEAVATYARRATPRTTTVLYGIHRPAFASDARRDLGIDGDALVIGGIGRLDRQKGWDVLCQASSAIKAELPEADIIVVGDGPERESLTQAAACAEVRFLGYRETASSLMPAFDLLVVPSRYEAFGLVALEAMHAGVPVIASDVGGLPEVLGNSGVLVPVERPELLARAVLTLARDEATRGRYAKQGAARARSQFSPDRMGDETSAAYRAIAS